MFKTTANHKKYWSERQIDWKTSYFDTYDHPHRKLIIDELKKINFGSLLEIGCASGPNLFRIQQAFPKAQLGGIDISKTAIETAKQLLPRLSALDVGSAEDIFLSDKSTDVILSDACLIYMSPLKIHSVIRELKRVCRRDLILVEFYAKSIIEQVCISFSSGYFAHSWPKLLEQEGFYDVQMKKISTDVWGFPWDKWGYIITAKL